MLEDEEIWRAYEQGTAGGKPQPGAGPPQEPGRFNIIDPTGLQGAWIPPREWVVEDWLPVGTVTACYGDGGVGKTLLAQQLMTATATHKPWCGA